jgi:hypothetical protein
MEAKNKVNGENQDSQVKSDSFGNIYTWRFLMAFEVVGGIFFARSCALVRAPIERTGNSNIMYSFFSSFHSSLLLGDVIVSKVLIWSLLF